MAQSDSGAWGYVSELGNAEEAAAQAIAYCRSYNQSFEAEAPCAAVYLHGEWLPQASRASEILTRIPQWKPSEPSNTEKYIKQAREDFSSGEVDLALAKAIWIFQYGGLEQTSMFDMSAFYGADLWADIAREHPHAKVLMHYAAIKLKEDTLAASNFAQYHIRQFAELNDRLYFDSRSTELFINLHDSQPEKAVSMFHYVKDILLEQNMFEVLNDYISPERDYARAFEEYERALKSKDSNDASKEFMTKHYKIRIAQLIAILAQNDRQLEAQDIFSKANQDIDDRHFHNILNQALDGKVVTSDNYDDALALEQ